MGILPCARIPYRSADFDQTKPWLEAPKQVPHSRRASAEADPGGPFRVEA